MYFPSGITISQDGQTVYWTEYAYGNIRQVYLPTMQTSYVINSATTSVGYREGVGSNAAFVYPYGIPSDALEDEK